MLDFTSALYLGLRHATTELRPWARLTTGVPAALATPALAGAVARALADLTGVERVTLARSTLHAFWDLFVIFSDRDTAIYMDACAYPIARWGAERAAGRGVPLRTFAHADPTDLGRRLTTGASERRRPLVVTDGICPGCGKLAPIPRYLEQARRFGGSLVVDDTQALGIVGRSPDPRAPYGTGGGGSLSRHGIASPHVLLVSSLAKGFGVPVTMVGGSAAAVARFEAGSATRVHCSPPSFAELHAIEHALAVNRAEGDARRLRLASLVQRMRRGLQGLGIKAGPSLFPVQRLDVAQGVGAGTLYARLLRRGIRAVLHRPGCGPRASVSFVVTARHAPAAIDRAIQAVAASARAVA